MKTRDHRRHGWTTVLRRQPADIVDGQPRGGFTSAFEIICCHCGDNPGLDYSEVPSGLQRVRGPYPITDGVAAYKKHVGLHQQPGRRHRPGPPTDAGFRR